MRVEAALPKLSAAKARGAGSSGAHFFVVGALQCGVGEGACGGNNVGFGRRRVNEMSAADGQ